MNCAAKTLAGRVVAPALLLFLGACAVPGAGTSDALRADAVSTKSRGGPDDARIVRTADAGSGAHGRMADADPPESLPQVDLTPQLLFQLLASEIAAQRGQTGSATATYLSMARETRDPRLARRATELALSQQALDRALPAAELWSELSPDSPLATRTLETLLLSTGKLEEAEPLMVKRRTQAKTDNQLADFYRGLDRSLARVTDKPAALALLERVARDDAGLTEARLALAATAARAENTERAQAEAQAAVQLDPDNEQTAITAARLAQPSPKAGGPGLQILADYLGRKPDAIEARFAYARMLAGAGQKAQASQQFEEALRKEPDSPAILFSLAQLAYQTDQKPVATKYLERYVALPETVQRDNNPAYLFLGQIAEESRDYKAAVGHYAKVGTGEQYLDARIRQAVLTAKLGDVAAGQQVLRTTNVGSPRERVRLTSAEAEVLRVGGRLEDAFKLLDEALAKQPDNTDLLYDHAMAAERINRLDILEKSLRAIMSRKPDSAHAYNALGYTLADRNQRLAEAQKLIEKALELSPDDAHIIDSLGWVLFRRGDLKGAEKALRKAYDMAPEAEIATHLGEVLWQLGQRDEARRLWAEARTADPENATLRETLARLNVNL